MREDGVPSVSPKLDAMCEMLKTIHDLQERNKQLEAQLEKVKWHFVEVGDLPKDRRNVYVVYLNGENFYEKTIASYRHKYWVFNGLKTECEVIAWYELPTWGK